MLRGARSFSPELQVEGGAAGEKIYPLLLGVNFVWIAHRVLATKRQIRRSAARTKIGLPCPAIPGCRRAGDPDLRRDGRADKTPARRHDRVRRRSGKPADRPLFEIAPNLVDRLGERLPPRNRSHCLSMALRILSTNLTIECQPRNRSLGSCPRRPIPTGFTIKPMSDALMNRASTTAAFDQLRVPVREAARSRQ